MGQASFHEVYSREEELVQSSPRAFGFLFSLVFAIIGILPLFNSGGVRIWALAVGVAFLFITLIWPKALSPLNLLWFKFGMLLHYVTNPVILFVMFYVVFTPIAFLARCARHRFLALEFEADRESYWVTRSSGSNSMSDQF